MQNAHLKLKEIIWEITGECKNNCAYCGSKNITKSKTPQPEQIIKIAEEIAKFPPQEIDISGGDPLLVSKETHKKVLEILKNVGINCKILVNPKSLIADDINAHAIISMYDWVGVSINSKEELDMFMRYKELHSITKFTVITNFNVKNLFSFDIINNFVKQNRSLWMIQFTVYPNKNNPLALYEDENSDALLFLENKFNESDNNIILSDNIRCDVGCGAGLSSLGILFDGKVVPCLSMRSWTHIDSEYSIYEEPLEDIWKHAFNEQRFGEFCCCKDVCHNKTLKKKIKEDFLKNLFKKEVNKKPNPTKPRPITLVYGVPNNMTIMYGVPSEPSIMMYAVISDKSSENYWLGTYYESGLKDEKNGNDENSE